MKTNEVVFPCPCPLLRSEKFAPGPIREVKVQQGDFPNPEPKKRGRKRKVEVVEQANEPMEAVNVFQGQSSKGPDTVPAVPAVLDAVPQVPEERLSVPPLQAGSSHRMRVARLPSWSAARDSTGALM